MAAVKKGKNDPTEEELAYFQESIEENQPTEDVSRTRSIASAVPRGATKFLQNQLDNLIGLTGKVGENLPIIGEEFESASVDMEKFNPTPEEKIQNIEQLLPIQEGRYIESSLEKGGKILPAALASSGGAVVPNILKSVAGGFLGQGGKELGAPEWVQSLLETAPFLAPSFGKKIPLKGEEKELGDFARRMGMTEEEIAVSLERGGLKDELAFKLASKGGKVPRIFDATYGRLGGIWDTLKTSYGGTTPMKPVESSRLINKMSNKLSKMPAEVRNKIQQDFNDFIGTEMNGENIMDFWKNMNYYISKGDRVIGTLKDDLSNAANQISPEFGKDFRLANKLYQGVKTTSAKLRPDIADKLVAYGEAGMVVKGIVQRDLGLLKSAIGAVGGRKLAQELAVNPRLQRLVDRMGQSMGRGRYAIAQKILNSIQDLIGSDNSEASRALSGINIEEMFEYEKK